jgi:hypothetical protein
VTEKKLTPRITMISKLIEYLLTTDLDEDTMLQIISKATSQQHGMTFIAAAYKLDDIPAELLPMRETSRSVMKELKCYGKPKLL